MLQTTVLLTVIVLLGKMELVAMLSVICPSLFTFLLVLLVGYVL